MKDKIFEISELLKASWLQYQDLSLVQLLHKIAAEAGIKDQIIDMNDDTLMYQLKMRLEPNNGIIPGIAKDYEPDFKTALLKSRKIKL